MYNKVKKSYKKNILFQTFIFKLYYKVIFVVYVKVIKFILYTNI
jgi:hypothetical protein